MKISRYPATAAGVAKRGPESSQPALTIQAPGVTS